MEIRRTEISDLKDIQRLNQELFKYEKQFSSLYNSDWPYTEQGIKNLSNRIDEGICYVAVDSSNKIVGYICGKKWSNFYGRNNPHLAELEHMFIESIYRGKGIGTKLIDIFIEKAKEEGAKTIQVKLLENNIKAYSFYKKQNFSFNIRVLEKAL